MSSSHTFQPHVTVAAVAERDGRFLIVREPIHGRMVLNQPAGHVEDGESFIAAVIRETKEETRWDFEPQGLVGLYRWRTPDRSRTFIRACFHGPVTGCDEHAVLDPAIDSVHWLSAQALQQRRQEHRSPLVPTCLNDYLAGKRYPLDLLTDLP